MTTRDQMLRHVFNKLRENTCSEPVPIERLSQLSSGEAEMNKLQRAFEIILSHQVDFDLEGGTISIDGQVSRLH